MKHADEDQGPPRVLAEFRDTQESPGVIQRTLVGEYMIVTEILSNAAQLTIEPMHKGDRPEETAGDRLQKDDERIAANDVSAFMYEHVAQLPSCDSLGQIDRQDHGPAK
jgi:hypothetical protein